MKKLIPSFRFMTMAIIIALSITSLMSCYHNGYGCKGRSSIITRVR